MTSCSSFLSGAYAFLLPIVASGDIQSKYQVNQNKDPMQLGWIRSAIHHNDKLKIVHTSLRQRPALSDIEATRAINFTFAICIYRDWILSIPSASKPFQRHLLRRGDRRVVIGHQSDS